MAVRKKRLTKPCCSCHNSAYKRVKALIMNKHSAASARVDQSYWNVLG